MTPVDQPSSLARMLRKGVEFGLAMALVLVAFTGCKPTYPKCDSDKDCKPKEFCVQGQCQQCRDDRDCPDGTCNKGRCEPKSSMSVRCSDDLQCPDGQSCINGMCKPCRADDECGEGGKCNRGRCDRSGAGGRTSGAGCTLEPIYFDFNENVLSTEATAAIDRNAECIKKLGSVALTLTGHSDPRGTEEYNLALSDRRAQSVKDRLGRLGVTGNLKVVARGELDATGKDEAGWAKDRRVDLSW